MANLTPQEQAAIDYHRSNLLTGNAAAQDGVSLFDSSTRVLTVAGQSVNINDITSGGAPSAAAAATRALRSATPLTPWRTRASAVEAPTPHTAHSSIFATRRGSLRNSSNLKEVRKIH
jgi:hypothetical protein